MSAFQSGVMSWLSSSRVWVQRSFGSSGMSIAAAARYSSREPRSRIEKVKAIAMPRTMSITTPL
jgi:hypothetical protein